MPEKDEKKEDEEQEVAMPVKTTYVTRGDISAFYPTTTTLESEHEASVVAKVGGVVEKFFVEEGDQVKAGQPLVQIETDRLQLELSRSESELKKMKNELDRTREIYKKQLVSSDAYEKLKFEYESRKASYELSKLELDFATVIAPIDGIISKRYVKVGNMVNRNEPVYHITDFDPLHAVIFVPEKELNKIALNQVARVQVDAKADKSFAGFVKRISPVVDANSGTFKVTIEVKDPERWLKPGMFGRLVIVYDEKFDTVLVDKKAVLSEDNSFWVFVVREGRAYKQMVKPGYVNDIHMEILEGVKDGDIIVSMGQNSLKNDSLVDIIEGPGKPEKADEVPKEETDSTTADQVAGE
jgi:membrane fusion protein (multidrug efflux system)